MAKSKKKTSNPELHKVNNTKLKFKNVIATKLTKLLRVHKQDLLELIQIPKSHEHGQFTLPIPRLLKLTNDQDQDRVCKDIIFSVSFLAFLVCLFANINELFKVWTRHSYQTSNSSGSFFEL